MSNRALFRVTAPVAAIACVLLTLVIPVSAAPEPDAVPRRWEITFKPGPFRIVSFDVDGEPRSFLYLTYKATNNSGEDLLFAPAFELATDEGEVLRSGRDVPLQVTGQLIEDQDNPLLKDQIAIIDHLLQGPENATEGIVIWPATDLDVDELVIYAAGFSGETKTIVRPDNGKKVVLRKSAMIRYPVPGDLVNRGPAPIKAREHRWIMR